MTYAINGGEYYAKAEKVPQSMLHACINGV